MRGRPRPTPRPVAPRRRLSHRHLPAIILATHDSQELVEDRERRGPRIDGLAPAYFSPAVLIPMTPGLLLDLDGENPVRPVVLNAQGLQLLRSFFGHVINASFTFAAPAVSHEMDRIHIFRGIQVFWRVRKLEFFDDFNRVCRFCRVVVCSARGSRKRRTTACPSNPAGTLHSPSTSMM